MPNGFFSGDLGFDAGDNWYNPDKYNLGPGTEVFNTDDPNKAAKEAAQQQLSIAGRQSGMFADQAQGNYANQTANLANQANYLKDLQSGKNSVSAEQLRQGLQQNLAAQNSMAAGASPANSAMAARQAANNTARLGYGMAGQQAVAGLQERNQATNNLTNAYLQQRQQDVGAANGARGNQNTSYASIIGQAPEKSNAEKYMPMAGAMMAAMSDKRLKTDIKDGDDEARDLLDKLKAKTFKYEDEKFGKGPQLGLLAQDLEKVLPSAVIEQPDGKAIDGAKLAAALAATLPGINKRLSKLEGDDGKGDTDPRDGARAALQAAMSRSDSSKRAVAR